MYFINAYKVIFLFIELQVKTFISTRLKIHEIRILLIYAYDFSNIVYQVCDNTIFQSRYLVLIYKIILGFLHNIRFHTLQL